MNSDNPPEYRIIESAKALTETAGLLEKETAIAFDLEADSMFHFTEKICLIQVATRKQIFLIDPLKIRQLSVLKPVFANPDIVKIFHGADYDVRSLYRDYRIRINNLFDTQIACRFLGMLETGLDSVVGKLFDIRLDKKFQKKDWSVRPLPEDMLAYAARDVIYLLPIFEHFKKELKQSKRWSWVKEECRLLSRVKPAAANSTPLFLKFKGAGRLNPRELSVLEAVLKLRIELARKKDRPPFKIFGNTAIMKLVKAGPRDPRQLKKTRILSTRQFDMYAKTLTDAIQQALDLPESALAPYPRKKAPLIKHAARQRIKKLKDWRDKKAGEIGLDPSLLCSKETIADMARQRPTTLGQVKKINGLKNWQKNTLGKEIVAVLNETHGKPTSL